MFIGASVMATAEGGVGMDQTTSPMAVVANPLIPLLDPEADTHSIYGRFPSLSIHLRFNPGSSPIRLQFTFPALAHPF